MSHGAPARVECIGDDVPCGELTSFPRAMQAKDDGVVVFAWIVSKSRAERDEITAKAMPDPRLKHGLATMPFGGKRMIHGGIETFRQL